MRCDLIKHTVFNLSKFILDLKLDLKPGSVTAHLDRSATTFKHNTQSMFTSVLMLINIIYYGVRYFSVCFIAGYMCQHMLWN